MSDTLAASMAAARAMLRSRRATESPPPSQLFILRVSKKVDPIFTPRDYPYSQEERDYIRSLAPFPSLPLTLVPTDENPYPPLMHYGWVVSDALKEQLLRCADAEGVNYVELYGPGRNTEAETYEVVLESVLEDLGIVWTNDQYIHLVRTKADPDRAALFFALYSNHELDDIPNGDLPSAEDVAKIRAFFQLTEPLTWYPTSCLLEWGECPLD